MRKDRVSHSHIVGSAQLFLNKKNEIRYARFRHYKGLNENKKPQFDYHKVENLETLKALLKTKDIQLSISENGQFGQGQPIDNIDPKFSNSYFKQKMEPRAGFDPATITLPR
jgi:hypothetical protein